MTLCLFLFLCCITTWRLSAGLLWASMHCFGIFYLVHWFRHSQSQSQSKLHFLSEWLIYVVQASRVGDSERVRGGTICPGSCSYAPPNQVCVRVAILLLWALSGSLTAKQSKALQCSSKRAFATSPAQPAF